MKGYSIDYVASTNLMLDVNSTGMICGAIFDMKFLSKNFNIGLLTQLFISYQKTNNSPSCIENKLSMMNFKASKDIRNKGIYKKTYAQLLGSPYRHKNLL